MDNDDDPDFDYRAADLAMSAVLLLAFFFYLWLASGGAQ